MRYTEEQINEWKSKSEKWDALGEQIADCYVVKNPKYDAENESDDVDEYVENEDDSIDLGTIGEIAAMAYGWL